MTLISCYVLTYNSEKYLKKVLKPLAKISDDIVILDSGSKDKTKAIAEEFNCRFIYRAFDNFVDQRNFAAEQCKHDWILFVDSDEICDQKLIESLIKIKENDFIINGKEQDALRFRRRWVLFGKEVHCFFPVSSPDYPFRAFRKSIVKFSGPKVHEKPEGYSTYYDLPEGNLYHYSGESVEYIFHKLNRYTTLAAQDMEARGKKGSWFSTITHSLAAGIKWYVIKGGWKDGSVGILLGFYAFYYTFMKYLKLHFNLFLK